MTITIPKCPRCGGRMFLIQDEYNFKWECSLGCGYSYEVPRKKKPAPKDDYIKKRNNSIYKMYLYGDKPKDIAREFNLCTDYTKRIIKSFSAFPLNNPL